MIISRCRDKTTLLKLFTETIHYCKYQCVLLIRCTISSENFYLHLLKIKTKELKKFLKIALVLLTVFILAVAGVALYFQKNIKPILVSEINKTLAVEVAVDEISLSGLRDFPNLGIKLTNVSINESTPYYKEKLLQAGELNLFVDIWKLYKGVYVIDKVLLREGKLRVADLNYGTNYDITKPIADNSSSPVSFEIKELKLIDCDVLYEHRPSKFKCNTIMPNTNIGLKYTGATTNINIKASLDNTTLLSGGVAYIVKKSLKINTKVEVNTEKQVVKVSPTDLQVEEVSLTVSGSVDYSETSAINLLFSNDNTSAKSLFSVLPASFISSLDEIDLQGDVVIDGHFKGKMYGNHEPSLGFDFTLQKASVAIKGGQLKLEGVEAKGNLNIPKLSQLASAKATCNIQNASSDNNTISGDISVSDFTKPAIAWNGKATLDAAFVLGLIDGIGFTTQSGTAKVDGKLALTVDIASGAPVPNTLRYAGKIELNNLSGQLADPAIDVKDIAFDISADNTKMVVNSASFSYNNTTGTLKGYIEDYTSLLNKNSTAELVGKLTVNNLTVNELYGANNAINQNENSSEELLPIKLNLQTTLTDFRFNDFVAHKMEGDLISNRTSLRMPKCEIDALGGKTIAAIVIKKWGDNHLLDITAELSDINITDLFNQFNNFEQTEITDKNISGTLKGTILAKIILDKNFEPVLPKLYAKANVTINSGALINYDPLKELSSFVNIEDLKNVRFKTLTNTIEIFDQTIFIPKMRIENNAMNIEIEGTHTFDGYMKYSMGLSVAELLATKANWIARKAEKRIEKNSNGGLTAYVLMEGPSDNLKIRYDRATVKENVKEEVINEKKKFIKALKGKAVLKEEATETKNYDDIWDE